MTIILQIPRLPESGNKIQNMHYHERSDYNNSWYEEVALAWRIYQIDLENDLSDRLPLKKAKVTFTLYFPDRRRRDKDNMIRGLKSCKDGLIHAGIIQDDDWSSIEDTYKRGYDKKNPRTEIKIEEVRQSE